MRFKIVFAVLAIILFLNLVPTAKAFSIGISPAERTIQVEENQQTVVYFLVSQGESAESQSVSMSSDVSWLSIDPQSFELSPAGQKNVKVTVMPLSTGNYTAKITASAGIPGIRIAITAKLNVNSLKPLELTQTERTLAQDAIEKANDMIAEARKIGADTTNAETMLVRAIEEFEKRNYVGSRDLAQISYNLALDVYNRAKEKQSTLFPVGAALIFVIIWGSIGVVVTVYELVKALRKRSIPKRMQTFRDHLCSECGKPMGKTFDGYIVKKYACPSCGHEEVRTK